MAASGIENEWKILFHIREIHDIQRQIQAFFTSSASLLFSMKTRATREEEKSESSTPEPSSTPLFRGRATDPGIWSAPVTFIPVSMAKTKIPRSKKEGLRSGLLWRKVLLLQLYIWHKNRAPHPLTAGRRGRRRWEGEGPERGWKKRSEIEAARRPISARRPVQKRRSVLL